MAIEGSGGRGGGIVPDIDAAEQLSGRLAEASEWPELDRIRDDAIERHPWLKPVIYC